MARNAQLLIRAGYVHKTMAGVYSYLPLGLKVVENIKQIVREEMNKIDSQELVMSTLQRKETWQETGRWSPGTVIRKSIAERISSTRLYALSSCLGVPPLAP